MKTCVIVTDDHGTPSVIGPFKDSSSATKYAQKVISSGYTETRIAQIHPPEKENNHEED